MLDAAEKDAWAGDAASRRITTVVIADGDRLRRELLVTALDACPGILTLGASEEGGETVRAAARLGVHVAVSAISLCDMTGLELVAQLRAVSPATLPILLDDSRQGYVAGASRPDGVRVLRTPVCSFRQLLAIVRETAFAGGAPREEGPVRMRGGVSDLRVLSVREHQILRLIGQGFANREIAAALGISVRTVEVHKTNIKAKLALRRSYELVSTAIYALPSA